MVERRAELEAAIEADPDDTRAYAVYGDYLQELGDPRGELIALQLAHATEPDPQLAIATRDFFRRYPHLLPPFESSTHLHWSCGFVRRAEVPASVVPSVIGHPSCRFLVELAVFWSDEQRHAIDAVAAHPRPTLRGLALGADRPPDLARVAKDLAEELEWTNEVTSLDALWPEVPNLERLRILDGNQMLGTFDLPKLVELELRTTQPEPFLAAVAGASWPALERFDLGLEMVNWRPPVVGHLRHFLFEAPPPKLAHFGLRGARRLLFDAIRTPREIAASALGRIRSLDLTRNLLVDSDAELLIESGVRLERLDVSRNQLTADVIRALGAIATTVIADEQYDPDDDPIEGLYDY